MAPKDSAECGGPPTIAAFATLAYWNDIASVSAGATELPRSVGVKNAYDLDQQSELKRASTFQAWGRRGPDRQQAVNLGVFYEDNGTKKRWILKCDDPKTLTQIDAVFVTIEPNGGSYKPSSKPLLFAYLKVSPNHP
jgi:hypothetical protein